MSRSAIGNIRSDGGRLDTANRGSLDTPNCGSLDNDLSIAVAAEEASGCLELGPKLRGVVDLAVVGNDEPTKSSVALRTPKARQRRDGDCRVRTKLYDRQSLRLHQDLDGTMCRSLQSTQWSLIQTIWRSRLLWKGGAASRSIYNGRAALSSFARICRPLNDAVYLFNRHAIKLRDLRPAHAVSRQCAYAARLGGRYYTGVLPGRLFPPYSLLIGRHLCFRTRHRRGCDGQDTVLPPSALPSGRGTGRGGGNSGELVCCVFLNRSSAARRARMLFSQLLRSSAESQSVTGHYPNESWYPN